MFILGLIAGALTSLSVVPQIIKIWKTKAADDVSYKMFFVLASGVSLWIIYGALNGDLPIVITNSVSLALNITVVVLKFRFGRQTSAKKKS